MFKSNPTIIQRESSKVAVKRPPLFLIHDASGTILSYFKLGSLNRDVYGIYDPQFANCGNWAGGLMEMAQAYIFLLKRTVPRGKILLGGWSFGGIVAVQMAHLLQNQKALEVEGIVLIDSVYSQASRTGSDIDVQGPHLSAKLDPLMKERVLSSLVRSMCMAEDWKPPLWNKNLPPAVLLRAMVEVKHAAKDGHIFVLDATRANKVLGWDDFHPDFVKFSIDVPGTHYTLFEDANLESTTKGLEKALAAVG